MKNRILSTLALWTVLILLPILLGNWGAFIIIFVFAIGTQREFIKSLAKIGLKTDPVGSLASTSLLLIATFLTRPWDVSPMVIFSLFGSAGIVVGLFRNPHKPFINGIIPASLSIAFIALPFFLAATMVHIHGIIVPIWIIAVAKFADVGALLFGLKFGKHKMAPVLSPKKTWEGFSGGLVTALFVGMIFYAVMPSHFPSGFSIIYAGLIAIPVALAGIVSDLIESSFKRESGIKDTGEIFPGIGGFFDLTDSLLLSMPVGYALIYMLA